MALSEKSPVVKLPIHQVGKRPTEDIGSRKTSELVVALCGAVGSGISTVADKIKKHFEAISYEVNIIKVSNLIEKKHKGTIGVTRFERIRDLQLAGNQLRDDHETDILAQFVIKKIVEERIEYVSKKLGIDKDKIDYGKHARLDRRHVTIIDSLKHPGEVELLQMVYGSMFYMFGVLCSDDKRKKRLMDNGVMSETNATDLMERDKKDKEKHGQQLLKTLQHADFFIRNSKENTRALEKPIGRFINLLLGQNDITPTIDEFGMYMAESSARRSGCLSRQVGAAILSKEGDIVAVGRNDVPRPFGGLYGEDNGTDDARCFNWHDHACFNEKSKEAIYKKIENLIKDILKDSKHDQHVIDFINVLKNESEIKDLLEYSRAVHAEMDAITTAARNGSSSLKDTTLYTTTFPCHHCARHIVASGIKRVYYIEPYEKSLATKLHEDSIALESEGVEKTSKKVIFLHFEGVAPKRYLSLFSCNNRKKDGRLLEIHLNTQKPTAALLLDTFIEYESRVANYVESLAKRAREVPR